MITFRRVVSFFSLLLAVSAAACNTSITSVDDCVENCRHTHGSDN